jgi:hypothetical protein
VVVVGVSLREGGRSFVFSDFSFQEVDEGIYKLFGQESCGSHVNL